MFIGLIVDECVPPGPICCAEAEGGGDSAMPEIDVINDFQQERRRELTNSTMRRAVK